MASLQAGTVLIADPFLKDPNFLRTAVLICEHQPQGSLGFVLNRKMEFVMSDLFKDLKNCNFPVFYGGPVQEDTIHFIHRCPGLITGSEQIADNLYWGGEFAELISLLQAQKLYANNIRLFLGYSGWSEKQLTNELTQKTWLTTLASPDLIFLEDYKSIWKEAIKQLGSRYEPIINYPSDPQLN